ncbi:HCLS1-associated protein X-1 isoform X1 [Falco cherrug]|uniref:HCLS1-associated protein X-1 isoform X1 n=1 Tax=Falco cherrug TaxID=345164 RepID=UPI00247B1C98|nr:HCLS1-associated protein X-1 isoform X1 [Falco cherrug]
MSFYDVFRGFFGFPGRHRPRDPLFGGTAWDEEEEEDDDGPAPPQPPHDFAFGFGFSPDGTRGAFEELFRDMGELLGVFGGSWARPPPPLEPPLPGPSEGSAGRPLRDSMLKQPDAPSAVPGGPEGARDPPRPWRPFLGVGEGSAISGSAAVGACHRGVGPCVPATGCFASPSPARGFALQLDDAPPASPGPKEDQDLDSHVSSAGLGTILKPDEPKSRSYFQSVSVTKVTLPDGAVEERRTVQDSQGRRETTVTRRRGDQAFITTTKEDGQSKDYREEVVNMDDRELAQFAGTWPQQDELCAPKLSDPSSVLGNFFRRWFSS